jgi:hypothetical protein
VTCVGVPGPVFLAPSNLAAKGLYLGIGQEPLPRLLSPPALHPFLRFECRHQKSAPRLSWGIDLVDACGITRPPVLALAASAIACLYPPFKTHRWNILLFTIVPFVFGWVDAFGDEPADLRPIPEQNTLSLAACGCSLTEGMPPTNVCASMSDPRSVPAARLAVVATPDSQHHQGPAGACYHPSP